MSTLNGCDPTLKTTFDALAFETGRIQGMTEKEIGKEDAFLKAMIPQTADNVNEGVDPTEFVEYHFSAPVDDYTVVGDGGPDEQRTVQVPGCDGNDKDLTVLGNTGDNVVCDPPSSEMIAGHNVYKGVRFHRKVSTPVQCAADLARKMHVADYIGGLRRAMPREGDRNFQRKLEQLVLQFGRNNFAENGGGEIPIGAGGIPALATHLLDFGTVLNHAQLLRANGWTGPVRYAVGQITLRQMILNHKKNCGLDITVSPFGNDFSPTFGVNNVFTYDGVEFQILDNPPLAYMRKVGAGYELVRLDPREFVAGTGAGATIEYSQIHQQAYYCCNGHQWPIVELLYFVHPTAAERRPYALPQIPGFSPDTRWNMEVKLVTGAYIPCNEDNRKFKFTMEHNFKFVPRDPRLMGAGAVRYAPYQRFANEPPQLECQAELIHVSAARIPQPPDNSCCAQDANADNPNYDPNAPRPIAPTVENPNPVNVAGEFMPECIVSACRGENSVTLCVERRNGSLGPATVDFATEDGDAVGGVDYTAQTGTLNWADGEHGIKCVTIALLGGAGGNAFSVNWSNPTGAAFVADACLKSCVKIPAACPTGDTDCPAGAG